MTVVAFGRLISTTVLLLGSTLWRLRRPLDAALLIPLAWLALIPIQVTVFGVLRGYSGAPRDNMYISIAIGNLMFFGLQRFLDSRHFSRLSAAVHKRLSPAEDSGRSDWARLAGYWWYGLAIIAVGLGTLHLFLMPKVPLFE